MFTTRILSAFAGLFQRRVAALNTDRCALTERQRIDYERAMRLELAVYTALNTRSAP